MIKFIGGQLKSFNYRGCDSGQCIQYIIKCISYFIAIMTMFPQFITKCCPSLRNSILVDQV